MTSNEEVKMAVERIKTTFVKNYKKTLLDFQL